MEGLEGVKWNSELFEYFSAWKMRFGTLELD